MIPKGSYGRRPLRSEIDTEGECPEKINSQYCTDGGLHAASPGSARKEPDRVHDADQAHAAVADDMEADFLPLFFFCLRLDQREYRSDAQCRKQGISYQQDSADQTEHTDVSFCFHDLIVLPASLKCEQSALQKNSFFRFSAALTRSKSYRILQSRPSSTDNALSRYTSVRNTFGL